MRTTHRNGPGAARSRGGPRTARIATIAGVFLLLASGWAPADDEDFIVTPPGLRPAGPGEDGDGREGGPAPDQRPRRSGRLIPCRINVVGPDGHFYQPGAESPRSLQPGRAVAQDGQRQPRRQGADPIPRPVLLRHRRGRGRRAGRDGARRGMEGIRIPAVGDRKVDGGRRPDPGGQPRAQADRHDDHVRLCSGDPHLHFPRKTEADDKVILDLLEAEDIHFGSILAYNEPAGPYTGAMETMDAPQLRGLGKASVAAAGDTGSPPVRSIAARRTGISTCSAR